MKIIKSFSDLDYSNQVADYFFSIQRKEIWEWGLGEDGELYYLEHYDGKWKNWADYHKNYSPLLLKNIIKISKEFQDWVAFI